MDGEIKGLLLQLLDRLDGLSAKADGEAAVNAAFREQVAADFARIDGRFTTLDKELMLANGEIGKVQAQLHGIDRRLDDQGRFIAAMIPTQLAAVPAQKPAA